MEAGGLEWDDAKAVSNFAKHGVAFSYARAAFDDRAGVEILDERRDDGEARMNLIAKSFDGIVVFITYTQRGPNIRIISARRASKQEKMADEDQ